MCLCVKGFRGYPNAPKPFDVYRSKGKTNSSNLFAGNRPSPPWFSQMEQQVGIDVKVSSHAVNDNGIFATLNHPCGFFADGKSFSFEVKTLGDAAGTLTSAVSV